MEKYIFFLVIEILSIDFDIKISIFQSRNFGSRIHFWPRLLTTFCKKIFHVFDNYFLTVFNNTGFVLITRRRQPLHNAKFYYEKVAKNWRFVDNYKKWLIISSSWRLCSKFRTCSKFERKKLNYFFIFEEIRFNSSKPCHRMAHLKKWIFRQKNRFFEIFRQKI